MMPYRIKRGVLVALVLCPVFFSLALSAETPKHNAPGQAPSLLEITGDKPPAEENRHAGSEPASPGQTPGAGETGKKRFEFKFNPPVDSEGKGAPAIIAVLIPHIAIVATTLFGIAILWLILKWRELVHRERIAALDKAPGAFPARQLQPFLWSLIWMGIGIGLIAALGANLGWARAVWGTIPLLIGLALLVSAKTGKNATAPSRTVMG